MIFMNLHVADGPTIFQSEYSVVTIAMVQSANLFCFDLVDMVRPTGTNGIISSILERLLDS